MADIVDTRSGQNSESTNLFQWAVLVASIFLYILFLYNRWTELFILIVSLGCYAYVMEQRGEQTYSQKRSTGQNQNNATSSTRTVGKQGKVYLKRSTGQNQNNATSFSRTAGKQEKVYLGNASGGAPIKESSIEPAEGMWKCGICFNKFNIHEMESLFCCEHMCCITCIRDYFAVLVREKSLISCSCPFCDKPDLASDEEFTNNYFATLDIQLQRILDPSLYAMFSQKLRDRTLNSDPLYKWCQKCSYGFYIQPGQKRLTCAQCEFVWCSTCNNEWENQHNNMTCEEFSTWKKEKNETEKLEHFFKTAEKLICPKCKHPYALDRGGCLHFTCTQCKHQFCSGCQEQIFPGKCDRDCRKGLHAHHPRNCLYFLRDYLPGQLQQLLANNSIHFSTEGNGQGETCGIRVWNETTDGCVDALCGLRTPQGYAGLCEIHYVEYLCKIIWDHKIDVSSLSEAPNAKPPPEGSNPIKPLLDSLPSEATDTTAGNYISWPQTETTLKNISIDQSRVDNYLCNSSTVESCSFCLECRLTYKMINCEDRLCLPCVSMSLSEIIREKDIIDCVCPICHKPEVHELQSKEAFCKYFEYFRKSFSGILNKEVLQILEIKFKNYVANNFGEDDCCTKRSTRQKQNNATSFTRTVGKQEKDYLEVTDTTAGNYISWPQTETTLKNISIDQSRVDNYLCNSSTVESCSFCLECRLTYKMINCEDRLCLPCVSVSLSEIIREKDIIDCVCPICHKPEVHELQSKEAFCKYFEYFCKSFSGILNKEVLQILEIKLKNYVANNFGEDSSCTDTHNQIREESPSYEISSHLRKRSTRQKQNNATSFTRTVGKQEKDYLEVTDTTAGNYISWPQTETTLKNISIDQSRVDNYLCNSSTVESCSFCLECRLTYKMINCEDRLCLPCVSVSLSEIIREKDIIDCVCPICHKPEVHELQSKEAFCKYFEYFCKSFSGILNKEVLQILEIKLKNYVANNFGEDSSCTDTHNQIREESPSYEISSHLRKRSTRQKQNNATSFTRTVGKQEKDYLKRPGVMNNKHSPIVDQLAITSKHCKIESSRATNTGHVNESVRNLQISCSMCSRNIISNMSDLPTMPGCFHKFCKPCFEPYFTDIINQVDVTMWLCPLCGDSLITDYQMYFKEFADVLKNFMGKDIVEKAKERLDKWFRSQEEIVAERSTSFELNVLTQPDIKSDEVTAICNCNEEGDDSSPNNDCSTCYHNQFSQNQLSDQHEKSKDSKIISFLKSIVGIEIRSGARVPQHSNKANVTTTQIFNVWDQNDKFSETTCSAVSLPNLLTTKRVTLTDMEIGSEGNTSFELKVLTQPDIKSDEVTTICNCNEEGGDSSPNNVGSSCYNNQFSQNQLSDQHEKSKDSKIISFLKSIVGIETHSGARVSQHSSKANVTTSQIFNVRDQNDKFSETTCSAVSLPNLHTTKRVTLTDMEIVSEGSTSFELKVLTRPDIKSDEVTTICNCNEEGGDSSPNNVGSSSYHNQFSQNQKATDTTAGNYISWPKTQTTLKNISRDQSRVENYFSNSSSMESSSFGLECRLKRSTGQNQNNATSSTRTVGKQGKDYFKRPEVMNNKNSQTVDQLAITSKPCKIESSRATNTGHVNESVRNLQISCSMCSRNIISNMSDLPTMPGCFHKFCKPCFEPYFIDIINQMDVTMWLCPLCGDSLITDYQTYFKDFAEVLKKFMGKDIVENANERLDKWFRSQESTNTGFELSVTLYECEMCVKKVRESEIKNIFGCEHYFCTGCIQLNFHHFTKLQHHFFLSCPKCLGPDIYKDNKYGLAYLTALSISLEKILNANHYELFMEILQYYLTSLKHSVQKTYSTESNEQENCNEIQPSCNHKLTPGKVSASKFSTVNSSRNSVNDYVEQKQVECPTCTNRCKVNRLPNTPATCNVCHTSFCQTCKAWYYNNVCEIRCFMKKGIHIHHKDICVEKSNRIGYETLESILKSNRVNFVNVESGSYACKVHHCNRKKFKSKLCRYHYDDYLASLILQNGLHRS